jgi:hypothetical protein
MKKVAVVIGGLALAGCGAGAVQVVQNIYDQIQQASQVVCQLRPTFATIDALIKALGGPPVVDVIAGLFCTQARALSAQRAPKATVAPDGSPAIDLGVVIINGKPVRIQVLR